MQQTADVDANQTLAGTPVSGSFSCFCAAAVEMAVLAAVWIAAGSSSCSCAAAAITETAAAARKTTVAVAANRR